MTEPFSEDWWRALGLQGQRVTAGANDKFAHWINTHATEHKSWVHSFFASLTEW